MVRVLRQLRGARGRRAGGPLASFALALAVVVTPAGLEGAADGLSLVAQSAQAKDDGDRGNGGGNAGGDRDNPDGGKNAAGAGKPGVKGKPERAGQEKAGVAYTFSKAETEMLLAKGWSQYPDGYKNHGQYVSAYVQIAKALGYSARDGALQANFLPLDWYAKQAELQALSALSNPTPAQVDRIAELRAQRDGAIAELKPGDGPQGDAWATVNLDYNKDGVVDLRDVAAYEADQAATTVTTITVRP